MMTQEQAQKLRVLLQEAFDLVLQRPIAFVLVAQDEERGLEIVSNAHRRELLPELLMAAAEIVRTPTDTSNEIPDHRATGESAGAKSAQEAAPGMECGHAAPGALQPADHGRGVDGDSLKVATTPPAAAVSERCWRRIAPTFAEQCPNDATGGVRLKLYPALSIQKRYGKRDMLALIFDLPICASCFSQMTAIEVINNQPPEMWQSFSKICQQRNQGILPIKENSEIEHLPFDDPEYVLLRRSSAEQRAASQSAPAGPQPEGASNGA